MNRLVCASALLLVVPLLMGATCTLTEVKPNPMGMPNTVDMKGGWSTNPGAEMALSIILHANNFPTGATNQSTGQLIHSPKTWTGRAGVVAGTYSCYGELKFVRVPGDMLSVYSDNQVVSVN